MENNKKGSFKVQPKTKEIKEHKSWWSNLGKGGRIAICFLSGAGVATAVAVPTSIAVINNKSNTTVTKNANITGDGKDLVKQTSVTHSTDGSCNCKIQLADGKSKTDIKKIEVKAGNKVLTEGSDYTIFGSSSLEILIKSGVVANNDNITIDITKTDPIPTTYNIYAITDQSDEGTVTGSGTFKTGELVTVTAKPKVEKTFGGWYENDQKIIDAKSSYSFIVNKDRILKAKFIDCKDFKTCDWSYIKECCDDLENANFSEAAKTEFCSKFTIDGSPAKYLEDFVGAEREVKLLNPDGTEQTNAHKVRVIGVEHDIDSNNKKIALTFEFANVICDSAGDSIAYQWNDTNNTTTANYDYRNSTIRYALTGIGGNGGKTGTKLGQILAGQKATGESSTWSTTYSNKTIISMLPYSLRHQLKTVKKTVGVKTASSSDYTEETFDDKLFLLSTIELGYETTVDRGFGTTYSYYIDCTTSSESRRIKKQLQTDKNDKMFNFLINAGQTFQGEVGNFAGVCNEGGLTVYNTRSPYSNGSEFIGCCEKNGLISDKGLVYGHAYPVAPAFCI